MDGTLSGIVAFGRVEHACLCRSHCERWTSGRERRTFSGEQDFTADCACTHGRRLLPTERAEPHVPAEPAQRAFGVASLLFPFGVGRRRGRGSDGGGDGVGGEVRDGKAGGGGGRVEVEDGGGGGGELEMDGSGQRRGGGGGGEDDVAGGVGEGEFPRIAERARGCAVEDHLFAAAEHEQVCARVAVARVGGGRERVHRAGQGEGEGGTLAEVREGVQRDGRVCGG